ncbi:hypothetical protein [Acetobacter oryzifermentans]|uniref:hypothetical protein n=1 Tax=Acetobacter TaxID=434 RepID=UPI0038CFCBAA
MDGSAIVARCETTKMFEAIEASLDMVSVFVKSLVELRNGIEKFCFGSELSYFCDDSHNPLLNLSDLAGRVHQTSLGSHHCGQWFA